MGTGRRVKYMPSSFLPAKKARAIMKKLFLGGIVMTKFKLVRYVYSIVFAIVSIFRFLYSFIKTMVMLDFPFRKEGNRIDYKGIVEGVKFSISLYKALMRAVFEWVNDGDMIKYQKNMVTYIEEVGP